MIAAIPTIHVVDDDDSFRSALARTLRAAGYATQTYASAGDFLLRHTDDGPGCLILDVKLPGPDGLDLQTALNRMEDSLPIIFLTGYADVPMAVRAVKAGAVDFLTKPVRRQVLLEAVKKAVVRDEERRLHHEQLAVLRSRFESLTPRERDVFDQVVTGRLNKQIAADLATSERTVKAHRARIMEKMHVSSVAELVHVADQLAAERGP